MLFYMRFKHPRVLLPTESPATEPLKIWKDVSTYFTQNPNTESNERESLEN